jgi:hypothetical protein
MAISGTNLFVSSDSANGIYEYSTSGAPVNPLLISGLNVPEGIAISGNDLFVVNEGNGKIGRYFTSRAVVNASLISGLDEPTYIVISPVAPVLSSSAFSNGEFQVTFNATADQIYTVQMTTNLLSTNWISLLVTNPPSGPFTFIDPQATNQQQFYRVETAQ